MSATAFTMEAPKSNRATLAEELTQHVTAATVVRCDEPLARRTTLRVGGPADVYVEPASEADLAAVCNCARRAANHFLFWGAAQICWCAMAGFAAW
jgi:hypothetical protein